MVSEIHEWDWPDSYEETVFKDGCFQRRLTPRMSEENFIFVVDRLNQLIDEINKHHYMRE